MKLKPFELVIVRPGGNDTALVKGLVEKSIRKTVNELILKDYSNVEQVGFYQYFPNRKLAQIEMAGGEFCGNAIRALAFLLLKGKQGIIFIKSSGINEVLKAGINKRNEVYTQIPVIKSLKKIKKMSRDVYFIPMEGIVFLITKNVTNDRQKIIEEGKSLLKQYNLLYKYPAAGVIFVSQKQGKSLKIDPVVWVRDVKTLFYESACASGTAAVGFLQSKITNSSRLKLNVKQPSGQYLSVIVQKERNRFIKTVIQGDKTIILLRKNMVLEV